MELRHIRYFLAVAEHRSFTRAAQSAHVTQSTLSHQIRQLEDQLGLTLFERTVRETRLTSAGQALLPTFRRALGDIDGAIRTAREMPATATGELRVGLSVGPAFMMGIAPDTIASFARAFPSIHLRAEEMATDRIAEGIVAGEIDLGVCDPPFEDPRLRFEPLFTEELVLVTAPDHPLAQRRRVRMVELHRQRMALVARSLITRVSLDRCFADAGIEPTIVAEVTTVDSLYEIARSSGVAAMVLRNTAERREGLAIIRIDDPTPLRTVGIVIRKMPEPPPLARAYVDTCRAAIRRVAEADGWPWLNPLCSHQIDR